MLLRMMAKNVYKSGLKWGDMFTFYSLSRCITVLCNVKIHLMNRILSG